MRLPGKKCGDARVGDMQPKGVIIFRPRRLQRETERGQRVSCGKFWQNDAHRSEKRDMRMNWRLVSRKGLVLSVMNTW